MANNKKSKTKSSTKSSKRPNLGMVRGPEEPNPASAVLDSVIGFLLRFRKYGNDILGIFLALIAMLILLGLFGLSSGAWLLSWVASLKKWLGWGGSLLLVGSLGMGSLLSFRPYKEGFTARDWGKVISIEFAAFSLLGLLSVIGGNSIETSDNFGGLVGWGLSELIGMLFSALPDILGNILRVLLFIIFIVIGTILGFGLFGRAVTSFEFNLSGGKKRKTRAVSAQPSVSISSMSQDEIESPKKTGRTKKASIPAEHRKQFKVEDQFEDQMDAPLPRDEQLPDLSLLDIGKNVKPDERHINQTAGLIEKTLAEFGIPAKVINFQIGPTVTQFAIEPGYIQKPGTTDEDNRQKVRVSQISALQKDLALTLSAERLRIQAPVPGRSYVGIEVPNKRFSMVKLRPILETETFYKVKSPLAIAMGRNVSGIPVVADLTKMPHLLIAGTTGSGKSVCIAAITTCLVMNNSPADLRIVMIDPKMVELVRFNGLPHLIGKVETNLERIGGVLRWVVAEMQNRYKKLEELRARDIESYNRKVQRRKEYETMPRIVVLIDELADLMMSAAESTETTIVRLAQMARAVGIHLIVATQRPSTDVVTGLIKANFPARLSFAVASGMDSRVILDGPGAESLLGRGDMLFLSPEGGMPLRAQGVMISDQEIENVINYWQEAWNIEGSEEEQESPWETMMVDEAILATRDNLAEDAIEIIKDTGRASASMFQRRLKIGYPRAARLVDELENMGVIGPSRGGGREREILIDTDNYDDGEL